MAKICIERQQQAVDGTRFWPGPRLRPWNVVAAGDVIEDALHDDDSDMNVAGNVGQELVDEIVDGVEGVAGEDTGDGRGAVRRDTRNIEVGEFGADRVVQQGG